MVALVGCSHAVTDEPEPGTAAWGGQQAPLAACLGNGDWVIDEDELQVATELGITATFLANPGDMARELLDPAGEQGSDGRWTWFYDDPAQAGDQVHFLGAEPLEGAWYANRYPSADHHALFDASTNTYGVHHFDDGLVLLGIASEEEGGDALSYDPPVPLLPLPLQDGDSWSVDAAAEGLAGGVSYPVDGGIDGVVSLVHRWQFEVDGEGIILLPAADLPVLRLRVQLHTEAHNSVVGLFASDSQRVTLFVAECLGVVARTRSLVDELDADYAVATEVLRFGFEPELLP
jgi:hypothetical protein